MKTLKLTLALLPIAVISTLACTNAQAADTKFYVGSKLGASYTIADYTFDNYIADFHVDENAKKTVFTINPQVGIDIQYNKLLGSRFEVEGFFHGKSKKDMKGINYEYQSNGAFINGYLDFHVNDMFTPYVGMGVGYSHNKMGNENEDSPAFNIGAGTAINFTKNLALDLNVRYAFYGDEEITTKEVYGRDLSKEEIKLSSVDFLAGIRYTF